MHLQTHRRLPAGRDSRRRGRPRPNRLTASKLLFGIGLLLLLVSLPLLFSVGPALAAAGVATLAVSVAISPRR